LERVILPVPVTPNRFFAPLWVLIFGTAFPHQAVDRR